MKLYHGSKKEFASIEKRQARKADYIEVSERELLEAIYFSPDYGFAFACAARPAGVTQIDNENKTINFEKPELFDPEETIYIYEADTAVIPEKNIVKVDENQYAVIGMESLEPTARSVHKAKELQDYYRLENWQEAKKEISREFDPGEFRMR